MPKVSEIAAFLEKRIPSELKMDYDNVGLLCGYPDREVTRVLVVLDITMDAIREAQSMNAELIVSHHPVIFSPMRTLTDDSPEGGRVIALLRSEISAICLHTNLDRLEGGVNTALAETLGADVEEALDMGCVCRLPAPVDLEAFLAQTADALGVHDIRYYDADRLVERIAVCGGAGGDIIYDAHRHGCDCVVTGEIKHHQWIDGAQYGINMIEAGHFATENVVVPVLAGMLRREYPDVDICQSCFQGPITRGYGF